MAVDPGVEHIVALVQPYHNNALKRITKMPLLHFLDTGLAAYLLKWNNPRALENGAMAGAFFESYVFSEIYKSYLNAGKEPPIFYYRDKDQREIDLLIYENGALHPHRRTSEHRSMYSYVRLSIDRCTATYV